MLVREEHAEVPLAMCTVTTTGFGGVGNVSGTLRRPC